eukprot:superscaffoldBa00000392_g4346
MTGTEQSGEERRGDEAGGRRQEREAELWTTAPHIGQPGPDRAQRAEMIPWWKEADTLLRSRQESINRRRMREKRG